MFTLQHVALREGGKLASLSDVDTPARSKSKR